MFLSSGALEQQTPHCRASLRRGDVYAGSFLAKKERRVCVFLSFFSATGTSSSDKRWACFTIDLVCRISALWRPSGLCGPDRAKGGGGSFGGKKGGGGKGGYFNNKNACNAKVKGNSSGRLFLAGGGEIFDPILSCTPAAGLRKGEPPRPWKKAPARLASPGASCWGGAGGVSLSKIETGLQREKGDVVCRCLTGCYLSYE